MDKHSNEWFTAFLREKAAEAKRDLKYDPRQFLSMLGADGGYLTVAKLVGGKNPSDGFVSSGKVDVRPFRGSASSRNGMDPIF